MIERKTIIVKDISSDGYVHIKQNDELLRVKYEDWQSFETMMKASPLNRVIYDFGVSKKIAEYTPNVRWDISLRTRDIKLVPDRGVSSYPIRQIPGYQFDHVKMFYTVPLAEAWRLYFTLKDEEGVRYSEEVTEFIAQQLEQRMKIDEIAQAEDWQYDVKLGGDISLRKFQKVGCAFSEATNNRTLFAFEMGLGKTIMALAIAIKNNWKTVVICPASLKNNWAREIRKLTGKRPYIFSGRIPENHDVVEFLTGDHQFFILNYDIIRDRSVYIDKSVDEKGVKHEKKVDKFLWIQLVNMSKPGLVICDESHYIKNSASNQSQAVRQLNVERLIHMTGTPVLNRPGELWPILNSLRPELFPSEELFLKQYTWDGKSARNVDDLKNSIKGIMIRRKQSDVIKDLPTLNRITDYHELGSKAHKIYLKVLDGVYKSVAEYSAKGQESEQSITNILVQIGRLKQVCAIDKAESTADLATQLNDSASGEPHNKVLIFSQYKAVAFRIAQHLGQEALCFVERAEKGFVTVDNLQRDRLVQQFQNDPKVKYLVVTEKTAKEGHNITAAGFVIFNDLFWTPAGHEQGEGRAYMRIGDPHGITSYYRITDMDGESIEEWVWDLLKTKMAMINQVVEGVEGARDSSIVMELINKMKDKMGSSTYRRRV